MLSGMFSAADSAAASSTARPAASDPSVATKICFIIRSLLVCAPFGCADFKNRIVPWRKDYLDLGQAVLIAHLRVADLFKGPRKNLSPVPSSTRPIPLPRNGARSPP